MKIEAASTAIHMNGSTVGSYDAVRTETVLLYPKSKSHSPSSQAKGVTRPKVVRRSPLATLTSRRRHSTEGRHSPPSQAKGVTRPKVIRRSPLATLTSQRRHSTEGRPKVVTRHPSQAEGVTRPKVVRRSSLDTLHKPKASLDRRSSEGRHSVKGGANRVRASDVRRQKSYVASKADPIRSRLARQTHL
jgi:hypothetical protein